MRRPLPVVLSITDAYNQVILGGSIEAASSLFSVGLTVAPSGITVISAFAGVANFSGLNLRAVPGMYNLSFGVRGTYLPVPNVIVQASEAIAHECLDEAMNPLPSLMFPALSR